MSMRRSTQCRSHPEYLPPPARSSYLKPVSPTRIDDAFARSHLHPAQIVSSKPHWSQPQLLPPVRTTRPNSVQLPPLHDRRDNHNHVEVAQRRQSPTSSSTSQPAHARYTPEQRREAVRRFKEKKSRRKNQSSVIRYQVRKRLADTRPRFRGRFYRPKSSIEGDHDKNVE